MANSKPLRIVCAAVSVLALACGADDGSERAVINLTLTNDYAESLFDVWDSATGEFVLESVLMVRIYTPFSQKCESDIRPARYRFDGFSQITQIFRKGIHL